LVAKNFERTFRSKKSAMGPHVLQWRTQEFCSVGGGGGGGSTNSVEARENGDLGAVAP